MCIKMTSTKIQRRTAAVKIRCNEINAVTGELYQSNKIIHENPRKNIKQNYICIGDQSVVWLDGIYSGNNETQQVVSDLDPSDKKFDINGKKCDSIQIEMEIFNKYNTNVEIWKMNKKSGKKKCVINEYLMKTPKQLKLDSKSNEKNSIMFYSCELPKQVSVHELTWKDMIENGNMRDSDSYPCDSNSNMKESDIRLNS